jgi:SPP1 family predicted phage head-tail adaptor
MLIDAGRLDRKLQLLTKTTTRNAVGQAKDSWTVAATFYGERLNLTSIDIQRGAGRETVPEGKYLIRWRDGITTDMRVLADDGNTYSIMAIDEPDRRKSLVLTLQGVSNG